MREDEEEKERIGQTNKWNQGVKNSTMITTYFVVIKSLGQAREKRAKKNE